VYDVLPSASPTHCEKDVGELQPNVPGVQGPLSTVAEGTAPLEASVTCVIVVRALSVMTEDESMFVVTNEGRAVRAERDDGGAVEIEGDEKVDRLGEVAEGVAVTVTVNIETDRGVVGANTMPLEVEFANGGVVKFENGAVVDVLRNGPNKEDEVAVVVELLVEFDPGATGVPVYPSPG
jgi:hypothetical protein